MTLRSCSAGHVRTALVGATLAMALLGSRAAMAYAGASVMPHRTHSAVAVRASQARPLPRLLLRNLAQGTSTPAVASPPGHFPFQVARSADGLVVLHYYREPATFAQQLIALAQGDLAHPIHDTLGFSLKRPVNVYIYAARSDFLAGAPVVNAAETGALADPAASAIYLVSGSAQDDGATDSLPHELTHIVFHQNEDVGHLESAFFSMFPNWLDEGLATYDEPASSAQVSEYAGALGQGIQNNTLVDLLRDFNVDYPPDPDTDFLAYSEAHAFIGYLVDIYGLDALHRFLAGARDGELNLDALTVFGADLQTLQSRWKTTLGLQPTVRNQGFAPPLVPPVQAFQPGRLSALASSTHAFLVWGADAIPVEWLVALALLTLWGLLALVSSMRRSRPRLRLEPAPEPLPLRPPEPVQGIAPPLEPYLSVLDSPARSWEPPTAPAAVATLPALVPFVPHPRPRWFDVPLLGLPLPLAVGAAALYIWLDPLHEWFAGYISAALVGVVFLAAFIWLEIHGRRVRRVVRMRRVGMLIALLVVLVAGLSATPVGLAQAQAYEARGAYALALRLYANAGESSQDAADDMIRVHVEWAQSAAFVNDFPTATDQLSAAIALDPSGNPGANARVLLVSMTKTWAQDLAGARRFADAVHVLTNELGAHSCDTACASVLKRDLDSTYLAWAGQLMVAGDYATAVATLRLVAANTGDSATAASARQDILEVQSVQALEAALAAGAAGDVGGMNARLHGLVARYPTTAAAGEASETPQPVTGTVLDSRGVSAAGGRLFFLAFARSAQAQSFNFDFNHDPSVFKVATPIGAGGAFTVRLQPGYWYVAVWDDPTMAFNSYFNAPLASGNDAFIVRPFTPIHVGDILGY
jgi:hypothetical protein